MISALAFSNRGHFSKVVGAELFKSHVRKLVHSRSVGVARICVNLGDHTQALLEHLEAVQLLAQGGVLAAVALLELLELDLRGAKR